MSDDETIVRQRLAGLLARARPMPRRAADSPSPGRVRPADPGLDRRTTVAPDAWSGDPGLPVGSGDSGQPGRTVRLLPGPDAFDPGRRGVRALAAVAAVVVLGAAGWAWWARPRVEPVAGAPAGAEVTLDVSPGEGDGAGSGSGGVSAAGADTGAAEPAGAEVVVAVAGRVRRPGLVRLPPGARVADALEAAGGALPGVDVALLNLARKVTDGELILVGVTAPPGGVPGAPPADVAPGAAWPGAAGPGAAGTGRVNLNTATLAELDTLPGVGPVLAQRIIDHRTQQGPFRAVSDLRQVNGIGDARYEDLKDRVTV